MTKVATYRAGDALVSFEYEPAAAYVRAGPMEDVVGRVRDALGPVVEGAKEVLDYLRDAAPDRVDVKFGIKVTGTMNWIVAKAATDASFEVTLSWANPRHGPQATSPS